MPTPALSRETDKGKPDGLKAEHTRTEFTSELLPDLFSCSTSHQQRNQLFTQKDDSFQKSTLGMSLHREMPRSSVTSTKQQHSCSSSRNIFSHSSCTLALMYLKPFAFFFLERRFWHLLKLALKSLPSIYCSRSWQFCFACTAYQENKKTSPCVRGLTLHLTALHLLLFFPLLIAQIEGSDYIHVLSESQSPNLFSQVQFIGHMLPNSCMNCTTLHPSELKSTHCLVFPDTNWTAAHLGQLHICVHSTRNN